MDISVNTWTIIFLIGAGQGLFLSLLIWLGKRGDKLSNSWLGGVVFTFSVILLFCVAYWTNNLIHLHSSSWIAFKLTYLIGPMMLFYVQTIKGSYTFSRRTFYHVLPFIGHIFITILTYVLINTHFSEVVSVLTIIQNAHLLLYAGLVMSEVGKGEKMNWVRHIAIAYVGYCLCYLSYYVMFWTGVLKIEYDYMVSVGMMFFIYFVGYYSYVHQDRPYSKNKKYHKSSLTPRASLSIYQQLEKHLSSNKPYLDSQMSLQILTEQLNVTTHVLSQVINEHAHKNFSELMNSLRIEYAMELMKQEKYFEEKLIAIAYDSGFNNKVSFINAFKKVNAMTPTAYRKQLPPLGRISIAS